MEMLRGDEFADVLDGGDGFAGGVVDGLAAGVDAGKIVGVSDGLGPGEEVGGLVVVEPAAFFLIEKEDGVGGEVFALGGGDGGGGVSWLRARRVGCRRVWRWRSRRRSCRWRGRGSRSCCGGDCRVCRPRCCGASPGGLCEPVAGEGEVLAQGGEGVVAGVVVAVEADGESALCCGGGICCAPAVAARRRRVEEIAWKWLRIGDSMRLPLVRLHNGVLSCL